jgi:hypothetical protein
MNPLPAVRGGVDEPAEHGLADQLGRLRALDDGAAEAGVDLRDGDDDIALGSLPPAEERVGR